MAGRVSKAKKPAQAAVTFIETMECLPVSELPEGSEWTYEIKLHRLAAGVWTMPLSQENTSLEA